MKPLSGFSFLNTTAEADSAVYMRPWNPLWHRGSLLENDYWLSIPLKGYYSKKYIWKHYIIILYSSKYEMGTPAKKKKSASESNFSANSKPYAKRF
jgi:hypothetical protein